MAFLRSPVQDLRFEDLAELLAIGAVETILLEFKAAIPTRHEFLKKLTSMANSLGGNIVIGATGDSDTGKLISIDGVDPERGIKQKFVQWSYEHTDPPVTLFVSEPIDIPSSDRKCYVVRVPESMAAPHFILGGKGLYIRTDEYSQRFEPALAGRVQTEQLMRRREEVLSRRDQILARAQRRYLDYETNYYKAHARVDRLPGATFSLSLVPKFPASQVASIKALVAAATTTFAWRSVGFPRTRFEFTTQHESVIIPGPGTSFSLLELNQWGLGHYVTEIETESGRGLNGIHLNHFLGQLLAFLEHYRRTAKAIGLAGPLLVRIASWRVRGVPWIYFPNDVPTEGPQSLLDDTCEITVDSTCEDLIESLDPLAAALLQEFFVAVAWLGAADGDRITDFVDMGYSFNGWQVPDRIA